MKNVGDCERCGKIGCRYRMIGSSYTLELGARAQLQPLTTGKLKKTPELRLGSSSVASSQLTLVSGLIARNIHAIGSPSYPGLTQMETQYRRGDAIWLLAWSHLACFSCPTLHRLPDDMKIPMSKGIRSTEHRSIDHCHTGTVRRMSSDQCLSRVEVYWKHGRLILFSQQKKSFGRLGPRTRGGVCCDFGGLRCIGEGESSPRVD